MPVNRPRALCCFRFKAVKPKTLVGTDGLVFFNNLLGDIAKFQPVGVENCFFLRVVTALTSVSLLTFALVNVLVFFEAKRVKIWATNLKDSTDSFIRKINRSWLSPRLPKNVLNESVL